MEGMHRCRKSSRALAAALVLIAAGCADRPDQHQAAIGPEWVAADVAGAGVAAGSRITLQLGADGRASGRGGCNAYTGAYTLQGTELHFGAMAATKMACAPAVMEQEQRYFTALAAVSRYALADDGALMLTTPDGKTILFRK